eukprot:GCRY01005161.1.p1 GENE.GCRY01005161.1~~GCRY01005161.1.p1  ORF type:complete len:261 (-),score=48.77 GCRY01005161.1:46-828(-)
MATPSLYIGINSTITNPEESEKPQKRYFRQRAHSNPLSDSAFAYPLNPSCVDWSSFYPAFFPPEVKALPPAEQPKVEIVDVGCGYGGLTVSLSEVFPKSLILAMEIRDKVAEYVHHRIQSLRQDSEDKYGNCAVVRTNAMKYIPNWFEKGTLKKMFFCFPDPHFKKANHRRRIISDNLLAEYAYLLKPNEGILYTITDVKDLHEWMVEKCDGHPLFARLTDEELADDPCVKVMTFDTEEGKKVERNDGPKYLACYRRIVA